MSEKIILHSWESGQEERIQVDSFGKLNQAQDPTILSDADLTVRENWIKKAGSLQKLSKRAGIQQHNSNALSANTIINLYEAKFDSATPYLVAKDSGTASGAVLKYLAHPYTGSWNNISTAEEGNQYRYSQFKSNLYICNRMDDSDVTLVNKVWQGSTNLYEMGCLPTDTDTATLTPASGGFMGSNYYYYIITNLYDNYQESASLEMLRVGLYGGSDTAVIIAMPAVPNTRVKARKIYRSKGVVYTGSTARPFYAPPISDFYYITTVVGAGASSYKDIKADATLGLPISTENFFDQKRPYRSKYLTVAKNRMIEANLESSPLSYTAITSANITLVSSNFAGTPNNGGLTASGVYYYRFFKAYASHAGDRFGYRVGAEQSNFIVGGSTVNKITLGGSDDIVTITLANTTQDFDNWNNYIYVERSVAGTSATPQYYPLAVFTKGSPFVDDMSDANLKIASVAIDINRVEGLDVNTKEDVITNYRYKNAIAISDIGLPDLIPSANVKLVNARDNRGITGVYTTDDAVIAFTSNAISLMDTRASDSTFWTISQLTNDIGAMGQDTNPDTETDGHNGILQLPDDLGFIFFNRAYSNSATNEIKIYYFNGRNSPRLISDEIQSYLSSLSSFIVYGMAFDKINKWVWINAYNGSQLILIYDLANEEWYVFTFSNSAVRFYGFIISQDGRVFLGGASGYIYNYLITANQDNYYYSGTLNSLNFTAKLQSKIYDEFDETINAKQLQFNLLTNTATTTSSDIVVGVNEAETTYSAVTSTSGTRHKIKKRFNLLGNRFYWRYENSENKNIVIQQAGLDIKKSHRKSGAP